jgi:hypothetical protein
LYAIPVGDAGGHDGSDGGGSVSHEPSDPPLRGCRTAPASPTGLMFIRPAPASPTGSMFIRTAPTSPKLRYPPQDLGSAHICCSSPACRRRGPGDRHYRPAIQKFYAIPVGDAGGHDGSDGGGSVSHEPSDPPLRGCRTAPASPTGSMFIRPAPASPAGSMFIRTAPASPKHRCPPQDLGSAHICCSSPACRRRGPGDRHYRPAI